jgi:hypothetical protein
MVFLNESVSLENIVCKGLCVILVKSNQSVCFKDVAIALCSLLHIPKAIQIYLNIKRVVTGQLEIVLGSRAYFQGVMI